MSSKSYFWNYVFDTIEINTLIQLEPPYGPKKTGKISIFIEDLSRNSVCYFEMCAT